MGKYSQAEDRDSTVVNLENYRRQREIAGRDDNADQKPREPGQEGTGDRNAPIEGNRKD